MSFNHLKFQYDENTPDPSKQFDSEIHNAESLPQLKYIVGYYHEFYRNKDIKRVISMQEEDFRQFRHDMKLIKEITERVKDKPLHYWDKEDDIQVERIAKEWNWLVVPKGLYLTCMVSKEQGAPWGTCFKEFIKHINN
jgi:hypothetical protein